MKKLNRKGFTLIELLAVIVILAIIVVVTVPTIISTIEDARVSSIHNLAKETANSYDTGVAQDLLVPGKTLGGAEASTTWQCIGSIMQTAELGDASLSLADVLNLSTNDLVLTGTAPTGDDPTPTAATCSAIRLKSNGAAEVLLVAADGGKFAISGELVYALSSASNGARITATKTS